MNNRTDDPWLIRERVLLLVLLGATVIVVWLCWWLVKPFVPAIAWALVLTVLAHPLHECILARFKKWPSTLLVRQVGSEAVASIGTARKFVDTDRWELAIERFPWRAHLLSINQSSVQRVWA